MDKGDGKNPPKNGLRKIRGYGPLKLGMRQFSTRPPSTFLTIVKSALRTDISGGLTIVKSMPIQ